VSGSLNFNYIQRQQHEQIFRVIISSFESSWPINIKYVVDSSLLLVTWCFDSDIALKILIKSPVTSLDTIFRNSSAVLAD